jgi:glycosyltransferase involved in cell wall biosynthesis
VENLALITYRKGDSSRSYVKSTLASLGHATWLNGRPDRRIEWFGDAAVNRNLNRARVGLCLSATEGFMHASAQYLLAGLPVVTTPSVGGRAIFYEPDYVRTVAADPAAVAAAVEAFCAAPPDAGHIREKTLEKFALHRARFLELIRGRLAGRDPDGVWADGWPEGLPHKLHGGRLSLWDNLEAVRQPGQPAPWLAAVTPVQGA